MRHTKRQDSEKTLADLYRAMDRQHPLTITCLKEEKDAAGRKTGALVETVRTIEPYDIHTTKAGDLVIKAMDRATGESRTFRLDRLVSYTVHRTAYLVARPDIARTAPARPATEAAVIAYELARDERPARRHLAHAA